VIAMLAGVGLLAQEEVGEPVEHLSPQAMELLVGAIAFGVLFVFMARWVLPVVNRTLEARQQKIRSDLERAEEARREAERELAEYRSQLAGAREEANRIIEEARRTAEAMRRDLVDRAEREYQAILSRAQDEVRAERDRVFQELRAQVGELSLALAGRMVGESLDRDRHLRLVDDYIRELGALAPSGNGQASGSGDRPSGG
jgi:F-type H+-transporting ATPase subunit b